MKILRVPEVTEKVGFSRVSIWRLEAAGEFPQRRKITSKNSRVDRSGGESMDCLSPPSRAHGTGARRQGKGFFPLVYETRGRRFEPGRARFFFNTSPSLTSLLLLFDRVDLDE